MFTVKVVTRIANYNNYYSMDMTGQETFPDNEREALLYKALNEMLNANKFLPVVDSNGYNLLINVTNISSIRLVPMQMTITTDARV